MKLLTICLVVCLVCATTPLVLAQSPVSYKINVLVPKGDKSKEEKATITFGETSVEINSKKAGVLAKEFKYADITSADYSYSKKPVLSTGGAIATAVLIGVFVIPFLFMKKKQHWLTVKGQNEFIVLRLEKENFRQIKSELEVKKVVVNTVNEEEEKKGK